MIAILWKLKVSNETQGTERLFLGGRKLSTEIMFYVAVGSAEKFPLELEESLILTSIIH